MARDCGLFLLGENMAEDLKTSVQNFNTDAQTAEEVVNGNESGKVVARLGREYPTLPAAIEKIMKAGGYFDSYATLADANAKVAEIPLNRLVRVLSATEGGDYYKASADATSLTKSPWEPLTLAKGYTDLSTETLKKNFIIEGSDKGIFFLTLDRVPLFYVLNDGSFYLCGNGTDLREHVRNIPNSNSNPLLYEFEDSAKKLIGYVDQNLELFFVNNSLSIQAQIRKAQSGVNLNIALNAMLESEGRTVIAKKTMGVLSQKEIKTLATIEPFGGSSGKVQRIAAALKLANNKLLYMWGGGVGSPYNGDGEGVKLYKRIITYDNAGRVLDKGTKSLFRSTSLEAGIAKHPMLGRTKTGRIVLIWDERNTAYSTTNAYSTMIAFSDDEGVTFTEPVQIPNNPEFTFQIVGSTGTIVTMPNGRLVCPMYYTQPYQTMGMMYSDDNGATWQYGSVLNISGGVLQEPSISLDADNNIMVSSRHTLTNRRKHISKSTDGGQTLTDEGFNEYLVAPQCASSILYDAENALMLHSSPTGTYRDNFKIQISADNGATWKVAYMPFKSSFYIGYTQLIKLSTDLYAVALEGMNDSAVVNSAENVGIFIFNLKEVLSNVYSD